MKVYLRIFILSTLLLAFSCTGKISDIKPVLIPSAETIVADGKDKVVFTVEFEGSDVTASSIIREARYGDALKDNSFSTTSPGKYEFYAEYQNIRSDAVSVGAAIVNDLQLIADRVSFPADGKTTVKFSVIFKNEDVTSSSVIRCLTTDSVVEGASFATETPGKYRFEASFDDLVSEVVELDAQYLNTLKITADTKVFPADGTSKVAFTVTDAGNDVTSGCELLFSDSDGNAGVIDGNEFCTTSSGSYEVYARTSNNRSDTILVMASPVDTDPSRFDGFHQKVMVMQFTAQGCAPCYNLKNEIKKIESSDYDHMIYVSCHINSNADGLYTDFSNSLWPEYHNGLDVLPILTYNLDKVTVQTPPIDAALVKSTIASLMEKHPATSGISAYVMAQDGIITAHSDIKVAGSGEYRLAAWLLEDGVYAWQNGANGDIEHSSLLVSSGDGTVTGTTADISEGRSSREWTFDASTLWNKDAANAKVAIIVTRKVDGVYMVDNIAVCPVNKGITFIYK